MVATILVVAGCIYAVGLRADRIHAGRTVTEPVAAVPSSSVVSASVRERSVQRIGLTPGSVTVTYRGHTARYYAHLAYKRGRYAHRLHRMLLTRPSVTEAINLAGATYGNTSTLWALARCESGLSPTARNASGSSGLMQFMPSTFARTPFGRFSIWSPYASALAAGWMLQQGRRSEWVC